MHTVSIKQSIFANIWLLHFLNTNKSKWPCLSIAPRFCIKTNNVTKQATMQGKRPRILNSLESKAAVVQIAVAVYGILSSPELWPGRCACRDLVTPLSQSSDWLWACPPLLYHMASLQRRRKKALMSSSNTVRPQSPWHTVLEPRINSRMIKRALMVSSHVFPHKYIIYIYMYINKNSVL